MENRSNTKNQLAEIMNDLKEKYLTLLRETLIGASYQDEDILPNRWLRRWQKRWLPNWVIGRKQSVFTNPNRNYWQNHAMTMVGRNRLNNIRELLDKCDLKGVKGDFVECGVWRGGASMFAKAVIECADHQMEFNIPQPRRVWLFDSFEGLPKPFMCQDCSFDWSVWNDVLGVEIEVVRDNFARFGLLDEYVFFIKGWFKETLPIYRHDGTALESIAVLRCDGDMYESTMDILANLYHKVTPGGYVIIDDWSIEAVKRAIGDYFKGKTPEFIDIGDREGNGAISSVYWRKV